MTIDEALDILNKYGGKEMNEWQYYNYHCAQNKITQLILSGEYILVKKDLEENENDGNTYCHGIVNCKYFYDGECDFYSMGSGNPDDMPCLVQAEEDIKAFREWREQKAKEGK
jgi:hypothetical protein